MFGASNHDTDEVWSAAIEPNAFLSPSHSRNRAVTPIDKGWSTPFDDTEGNDRDVGSGMAWPKKLVETFRKPLFENAQVTRTGTAESMHEKEIMFPPPQSSISPTMIPAVGQENYANMMNLRGSTNERLRLAGVYGDSILPDDVYEGTARLTSHTDEGSRDNEVSEGAGSGIKTKNLKHGPSESHAKRDGSALAILADPPPTVPKGSVIPPPRKDEIWSYLIAYESCLQICIEADNNDSRFFLKERCKQLKQAFSLGPHLLERDSVEQQHAHGTHRKDHKVALEDTQSNEKNLADFSNNRGVEKGSEFASPRPEDRKTGFGMKYLIEAKSILDVKSKKSSFLGIGKKNDQSICVISFTNSPGSGSKPIILGSGQCAEFTTSGEAMGDITITVKKQDKGIRTARIPVPALRESDNWVEYWVPLFVSPQKIEGSILIGIKCTLSLSTLLEKLNSSAFSCTPTNLKEVGKITAGAANTIVSPTKSKRSSQLSAHKGYDLCLKVALRYLEFRRRRLAIHGPWSWLLADFARYHRISKAYCKLRYLLVVMMEATPTVDCLDLLLVELKPVLKDFDGEKLSDKEQKMLALLNEKMHALLQVCFENYNCLQEGLENGILQDVYLPPLEEWKKRCPAPALRSAVELFHLLNADESGIPTKQSLKVVESQIRAASRRRARKALKHVQQSLASGQQTEEHQKSSLYLAYANVCHHIISLVQLDAHIDQHRALPSGLELVPLSGEEYSKQLKEGIGHFLQRNPPLDCSEAVVALIHAIKDFEGVLAAHGVKQPKGGARARSLLGTFVRTWVDADRSRLVQRFSIEKQKTSMVEYSCMVQDKPSLAPPVNEMELEIRKVMDKYKAVVQTWPDVSVVLEAALCDIIRAVHYLLERGCAVHLPTRRGSLLHPSQKKVSQEKPFVVHRVAGLHMNSMKQILQVLPSIALEMREWTDSVRTRKSIDGINDHTERKHEGGAQQGDLFEKLLGELRASYANSLTPIVERLHENFSSNPSTSMKVLLGGCKGVMGEEEMVRILHPLTKSLGSMLEHLTTMFVPRAFAGICRGLWDHTFKDILIYLEELDELKENRGWIKRQSCTAATEVLVHFFSEKIAQGLGDEFQEKDIDLPYHVSRVRQMLAKSLPTSLTHSFSVY